MSKFVKAKFSIGSGSEVWVEYEGRFVGRFKYKSPKANANHFVKFLIANFSVEEYFEKRDAGMAPSKILEEKGYVNFNMGKILKASGYEASREGWHKYYKEVVEPRYNEL